MNKSKKEYINDKNVKITDLLNKLFMDLDNESKRTLDNKKKNYDYKKNDSDVTKVSHR